MMKVKHVDVLLFFVYIIKQVTARHAGQISDILEHLHLSSDKNPLIVVLNTKNQQQNMKDSGDFDDLYITGDDGVNEDINVYENDAEEKAKNMLYNYLLRTGDPQNAEEAVENDKRTALREALRASCQARVKCEKKCDKKYNKKNEYCPVNCKAVFDKLNLCEPPKEEKCKEKDTCGKRGKTMPPKWFLR